METRFRDCWFLTGATAGGKTSLGLLLAERLDAEIVSMDSMAVYRELDVGTAKPSAIERAQRPHHLIDVASPTEDYSIARYVEDAAAAVAAIRRRGRTPLFVGGTPLYLTAMLRGMVQGPPADWPLRRRLQAEAAQHGTAMLHERLAGVDPAAAERIHPHDLKRIVRALEVFESTGRPISTHQTHFSQGRPADPCRVFVLQWPREQLHRRIDRRVEQMIAAGWVDEVRRLLERYGELGRTASQAAGYREVIEHVRGRRPLAETIAAIQARTRRFARRQETWFRSLSECRFFPINCETMFPEVAEKMLAASAGTNTGTEPSVAD